MQHSFFNPFPLTLSLYILLRIDTIQVFSEMTTYLLYVHLPSSFLPSLYCAYYTFRVRMRTTVHCLLIPYSPAFCTTTKKTSSYTTTTTVRCEFLVSPNPSLISSISSPGSLCISHLPPPLFDMIQSFNLPCSCRFFWRIEREK